MAIRLFKYSFPILIFFIFSCISDADRPPTPKAAKGVIDLTNWDFEIDGPVKLSGEYAFYWNQLIHPDTFKQNQVSLETTYFAVPHTWNGYKVQGKAIPGNGYATYRLIVLLSKKDTDLSVKLLEMATSYDLFINGQKVSSAGVVGETADTSIPGFQPDVIGIKSNGGTLDIVVHISNFSHRLGGPWESITLGAGKQLQKSKELIIASDLFLFGSILIMAFYHLGLYSLRRKDSSALFFGLFCLLIALRILTTGERYLLLLYPEIDYQIMVKFEYFSYYLAVPVFINYFNCLFPDKFSKPIYRLSTGIGIAFGALVILLPVKIFSKTLDLYQLFTFSMFLYAIVILVIASLKKEKTALIFLSGFAVLFIFSVNDILYARNIIQSVYLVQFGLFIFIFSQAYILSRKFSKAFSITEIQGQKLRKVNQRFVEEIKERRRVEKSLKESHERFLKVLDSIDADVYVADMQTHEILFMNRHMIKIFNNDYTGKICWEVFRNESSPCSHCTNDKLLNAEGEPSEVQIWECQNPVTGRWYINYDRAILWEQGRYVRLQVATDVTDRKLAEEALQKANENLEQRVKERTAKLLYTNEQLQFEIEERKRAQENTKFAKMEAERASEAKSEFLANMSHELRTPMNHIIGFTDLLLDENFGDLNKVQKEYLSDVHYSGTHLLSLINDILDLSKVEAGRLELQPSSVKLRELLKNSLIMVKEKASKHGIKLSHDLNGIPDIINADERKLKQIMYNLLSNAVKFTKDGGQVNLAAQSNNLEDEKVLAMDKDKSNSIKVSVTDTGIGINSEDFNRIFKPFEQVERSINRKFEGTGLGLSLTKTLVEVHGGRIWVESEGIGKGSTFNFEIPITPERIPTDRVTGDTDRK